MNNKLRSDLKQWHELEEHAKIIKNVPIRAHFDNDPSRFDDFHISMDSMLLDYSKQHINKTTIEKLCDYAKACDLEGWRAKMFAGEPINITEDRAVLHTALRYDNDQKIIVDGHNIMPDIHAIFKHMEEFSNKVNQEQRFTHIVNIGVGGSDLGTFMAYEALKQYSNRNISLHFVSNIDATALTETLRIIDPEKTLFLITSKTFTTQETIANAVSARKWLKKKLGNKDISDHFVAITQNVEIAKDFGIREEQIFPIWDWVGGRFSIWSAVGLPLSIAIGYDNFKAMLGGAKEMDEHFCSAPFDENMPIMLGLIGMWNRNFLKRKSLAVIPYSQYLHRFPAYLQQLDMESNGKSIDRNGNKTPYDTGSVVFGEVGTNAQHAFFQLIHQGTDVVPCEFITIIKNKNDIDKHQKILLSNAIAQAQALMDGLDNNDPHKAFDGNRPSTMLKINELTPRNFGKLIALYEHKIFVQGILWNINSFDQCGVELGKILAKQIINNLGTNNENTDIDSSTLNLINTIKDK